MGAGADLGCDLSLEYVFIGISGNCTNVFDAVVGTMAAATDVNVMTSGYEYNTRMDECLSNKQCVARSTIPGKFVAWSDARTSPWGSC